MCTVVPGDTGWAEKQTSFLINNDITAIIWQAHIPDLLWQAFGYTTAVWWHYRRLNYSCMVTGVHCSYMVTLQPYCDRLTLEMWHYSRKVTGWHFTCMMAFSRTVTGSHYSCIVTGSQGYNTNGRSRLQAAGADPAWCNSTNRQNIPIQQNLRDFLTSDKKFIYSLFRMP